MGLIVCYQIIRLWHDITVRDRKKLILKFYQSFSNFSCRSLNPNTFFPIISVLIVLDLSNLKEQIKKAFCYQKLFWPFTVWIKWSQKNFKSFSWSLEHFFLKVGQTILVTKYHFWILKKIYQIILVNFFTFRFKNWSRSLMYVAKPSKHLWLVLSQWVWTKF